MKDNKTIKHGVIRLSTVWFFALAFGALYATGASAESNAPKKSYVPASVQALPGLQCKVYPTGGDPSAGVPVNTDDDGYARFYAMRATAADDVQQLTLACTDSNGKAYSYSVDLTSADTFAPRPLDLAKERGVDRPALEGDPLSYTQSQLIQAGYGLRPDPEKDPAAYSRWLASASRPGRFLEARHPDLHSHTVYVTEAPWWVGSVLTGSADYDFTEATFNVPKAVAGGDDTTTTEIAIWNGLGGYGTGSGLIQGGVNLYTSPSVAAYGTWREYCCGDPDSNGYGGNFTPNPGDNIYSEEWYCDSKGNPNLNGGYGCTYLHDLTTGAIFNCTLSNGSPCWSVKALPLCSASSNTTNCMTVGLAAEFIIEDQSPQVLSSSTAFTDFQGTVTIAGSAYSTHTDSSQTISTDPTVDLLKDFTDTTTHISVSLGTTDQTYFSVSPTAFSTTTPALYRNTFQALSDTEILVLGSNGNLWLEEAPFGKVPPARQQVDANVKAFQALSDTEVLVLGINGNLWLEQGPFLGTIPPTRQQVDANVKAFQALSDTEILVLGNNGNLWLEEAPFGTVPPARKQIDADVLDFQALSDTEVLVLANNGDLWLEQAPFGTVPPARQEVDTTVRTFQALSDTEVYVLGSNGNLWLEKAPFGKAPPARMQVDSNVASFQASTDTIVLVLGNNGNLWLEQAPFGKVPPARRQVDASVRAFQGLYDTEVLVLGNNGNLWLEQAPFGKVPPARQQVDASVAMGPPTGGFISVREKNTFQALSYEEVLVLGSNGKLWLEFAPFGTASPLRLQVDDDVEAFQALSDREILVLGSNGNLWLEKAPFGKAPPARVQVDSSVAAFQALSDTEVLVLGKNGNLWLEQAPFGKVPPAREQVDANVADFEALSDTEVLVLGKNGNLWLEQAPFGKVPPAREQVDASVTAFKALSDTEILVLGKNGNLWLEQAPFGKVPPARVQIDANVTAFQGLSATEVFVLGDNGNLWLEQAPFGKIPPERVQVDSKVTAFQALSNVEVVVLGENGNLWFEHAPFGTPPPARQEIDTSVAL
jgi:hypothetical protein